MPREREQEEKESILSETKVQVTVYINTDLLDQVEERWYLARKNLLRSKRGKLSKSKFYELMFEAIVADDKLISKIISKWEQS
jgi:hypothetical protein